MEIYPKELREHPKPLIGIIGNNDIEEVFQHTEFHKLNFLHLKEIEELPLPKRKNILPSDNYHLPGLIKAKWLKKHRDYIPSVLINFFSANDLINNEKRITDEITKIKQKTKTKTRMYKFVIVFLQETNNTLTNETKEEKLNQIKKRIEIDSKQGNLFLFSLKEKKMSSQKLFTIISDLSERFYREEGRRVKKNYSDIYSKKAQPDLFTRGNFKCGFYSEARGDYKNALKYFNRSYKNLLEIPKRGFGLLEIRMIGFVLCFKMISLQLSLKNIGEAIFIFKQYTNNSKAYVQRGNKGELENLIISWYQYKLFAEMLEKIPKTSLSKKTNYWESIGFYYHAAANYSLERKNSSKFLIQKYQKEFSNCDLDSFNKNNNMIDFFFNIDNSIFLCQIIWRVRNNEDKQLEPKSTLKLNTSNTELSSDSECENDNNNPESNSNRNMNINNNDHDNKKTNNTNNKVNNNTNKKNNTSDKVNNNGNDDDDDDDHDDEHSNVEDNNKNDRNSNLVLIKENGKKKKKNRQTISLRNKSDKSTIIHNSTQNLFCFLYSEQQFNHSKEIIDLFTRAYKCYSQEAISSERLIHSISTRIAIAYFQQNEFQFAKLLFTLISKHFRKQKWWNELLKILIYSLECGNQLDDYNYFANCALELCIPKIGLPLESRIIIQDKLFKMISEPKKNNYFKPPIKILMTKDFPLYDLIDCTIQFTEPTVYFNTPLISKFSLISHLPKAISLDQIQILFNLPVYDRVIMKSPINIPTKGKGTQNEEELKSKEYIITKSPFYFPNLILQPNKLTVFTFQWIASSAKKIVVKAVRVICGNKESGLCFEWVKFPKSINSPIYLKTFPSRPTTQILQLPANITIDIESPQPGLINEYFPILIKLNSNQDHIKNGNFLIYFKNHEKGEIYHQNTKDLLSKKKNKIFFKEIHPYNTINQVLFIKSPITGSFQLLIYVIYEHKLGYSQISKTEYNIKFSKPFLKQYIYHSLSKDLCKDETTVLLDKQFFFLNLGLISKTPIPININQIDLILFDNIGKIYSKSFNSKSGESKLSTNNNQNNFFKLNDNENENENGNVIEYGNGIEMEIENENENNEENESKNNDDNYKKSISIKQGEKCEVFFLINPYKVFGPDDNKLKNSKILPNKKEKKIFQTSKKVSIGDIKIQMIRTNPIKFYSYYTDYWKKKNFAFELTFKTSPVEFVRRKVTMDIDYPSNGIVGYPITCAYYLHNHSDRLQKIWLKVEQSEFFLYSGFNYSELVLLPRAIRKLIYIFIPKKCGKLPFPKIQFFQKETSQLLKESRKNYHIFVSPSKK
ncbi:trafficking protein particle complex subunit 11 [Anaeramoeba flamelloides]|uniref:Trafficking protein particle complex subunit 11 n=1 Tax=Anaeramoeba flamelloides TaxID=1746091 RepID=A0AAV7ZEN5_9EUKA|nr:trafficking protein particle complex subunit 11 [Anaeramoeba flamelloides]